MALTVEDGTGLADADAFVSLDDVTAYHAARETEAWTTGDPSAQEAAVRRASFFLSNSFAWKGYRLNGRVQALAWPRHDVVDAEGWTVPADAVPPEIKDATAEIALRELVSPGSMSPDVTMADKVKSQRVGEIAVEYAHVSTGPEASRPVLLIVRDLIGGLLASGSGNMLVGRAVRT